MMVKHLNSIPVYFHDGSFCSYSMYYFSGAVINAGVAGCCTGVAMSLPGICVLLFKCFMLFAVCYYST